MAVGGGGGHLYSLNTTVLCLGQDFWISEGHLQIHLIFTCKIENSFLEISVHFYLNLSSMSIVLAQEAVQITVK